MAELPSNICVCNDEQSFKQALNKAALQIAVLHFEAEWADECTLMNTVITELAKEFKHTHFIRVGAEEAAEVTQDYGVEEVPTCIVLKELKVMDKVVGADAALLSKVVKFHSTSFVAPVINATPQNLDDRLKALISSQPCMLFMKGDPTEPKCGFSRQIIELLNSNSVQFGHFDILSDNEVRQGLKKYSDWPTYPQLYSNGELIGGLDIVKELAESGELGDVVPKKEDVNTRIEKAIKSSPVMIFMKGVPSQPQCKFSKALMAILNQHTNIKFGHFNIFDDEEVRQGIKTYSNWPTFPQIYANGELVGGLDIIKELEEAGELESTLLVS